ncbi:MAG: rubredoxin [Nitrospirae bacterium]|nr:rubredoxin [Nitrospirota bacterium]
MHMYKCSVCGYIYDDAKEEVPFSELPDDWACPVCNAPNQRGL